MLNLKLAGWTVSSYYDSSPGTMTEILVLSRPLLTRFIHVFLRISNSGVLYSSINSLKEAAMRGCPFSAIEKPWVKPGTRINAFKGDAPGKTELDPELVGSLKLVVELLDQALVEGEAQNVGKDHVYAELREVVAGIKSGRTSQQEVTIFDSVGIAVEDIVAKTYVYSLTKANDLGTTIKILPEISSPEDVFSLVA